MQLTLKQQKYKYPDEDDTLDQYGIEKTMLVIDESIKKGEKRILDLIGFTSEVCVPLNLAESGPVREMKVFYDREGVRALKLTLESGLVSEYG